MTDTTPRKRLPRTGLWIAGALAILLAVFVAWRLSATGPKAGEPARLPAEIRLFDGRTVTAGDLRGKVVLVTFWATWCPACVQEFPHLERAYRTYRPKGLEVLTVSLDDTTAEVEKFLRDGGYSMPAAMLTPELDAAWGPVRVTPTAFLVGRDGRIAARWRGPFHDVLEQSLRDTL